MIQMNLFTKQKQTPRPEKELTVAGRRDSQGVWDGHVHTVIFKMDNQQGPTAQHMELCSMLCSSLDGTRIWGRMYVQLLHHIYLQPHGLYVGPQAPLSSTISQSLLKFMSIELVMLSNHLILCCPLLLLPSAFPSIRVFSNELALHIKWLKYH